MKNAMRPDLTIKLAVAIALCIPLAARSADVQFATDVGVGTSDNIKRTSVNERSETIEQAALQFSVQSLGPRFTADVRGDLAYLNYSNDTYASELVGNAGAALNLELLEDRLTWSLTDLFGQARRDLFTAVTPQNRENVNSFGTGPNLRLSLSGASRLVAYGRYSRVDYQTKTYNTDRYIAEVGFEHDTSETGHLGLRVNHERVNPQKGSLIEPYNRQEIFGSYHLEGARAKVNLDIGGSRLDRSAKAEDGVLIRFDATRKVSELSAFTLKAGRYITDTGLAMTWNGGSALPTQGLETQSLSRNANPYTTTYGQLDWAVTGRRTSLSLSADIAEERYSSTPLFDRTRYAAGVQANRDLTPRLSARTGFIYNKYHYSNVVGSNSDKTFNLGLNWKLTRHLSLDLLGEWFRYESQLVAIGNANETRAWLKIRYTRAGQ